MEEWSTHSSCEAIAVEWLVRLAPFIKNIHNKYHETIFIDFNRIHLMFDEQKKPLREAWDSNSKMWTKTNPLPINVIGNNEELLAIWDSTFHSAEHVRWMMNVAKQHDYIVLACLSTTIICYTIQITQIKGKTIHLLAPDVNTTIYHCRSCGKKCTKRCRCKYTYYCDVACQKVDWARHKPGCEISQ